ncbi:MAG: translation initiation factor IF-3 [Candidatus Yanofskybacteria bacterium]|nr:translation initiation factor IF-3 [Candidatus Yanofskybacteria bacterium]
MIRPLRINNQIRAPQVQVIDDAGQQLGTMALSEALKIAIERNLDLVEVGPNAQPPIAKVMDYGKYLYQKERQEKKAGGNKSRGQESKNVRIGFKTGAHDLAFKAKQINEFLREGYTVKIELTLRGREKGLANMGRDKLVAFLQTIEESHVSQGEPKRSPYGWYVIVQKVIKK